eukprot:2412137-Prymnesium_polylepis.1
MHCPKVPHVGASRPGRRRTECPSSFKDGLMSAPSLVTAPLQVEGGRVDLRNGTLIALNTAPKGHGSSIYLTDTTNSESGSNGADGDSYEAAV